MVEFQTLRVAAKAKAESIESKLRADDTRLGGSVLLLHQDGSVMLFDRSFVVTWESAGHTFALVITENHGTYSYPLSTIKHLRAIGPRLGIMSVL